MKKVISCAAAFIIAATTAVSTVAVASLNLNKDPNGDGSLTIADASFIDQCLTGKYNPSDLTELDVDDNDVVSVADSQLIRYYDAGVTMGSGVIGPEALEPLAQNSISRYYFVYDAQTGVADRAYSLSVTDVNNTNGMNSPDSVIGSDDRVPDWSNSGTAKIVYVNSNNQTKIASGFVVGAHTIATNASCLFDTVNDDAYSISSILLFEPNQTSHTVTPVELHIPATYVASGSETNANNYAMITVEENLSSYMSYNLGEVTDLAGTDCIPIVSVGFPVMVGNNVVNNATTHSERMSTGAVNSVTSSYIEHTADTSTGNDGGPIYAVESVGGVTYHTVVGINTNINPSWGSSKAIRFDAAILKFYKGNNNIQY